MEGFLVKTLKRLRKEVPRRFKDLRAHCDLLLVSISEIDKDGDLAIIINYGKDYLDVLLDACDCHQPRLTEIVLDAIHFFIEHGYLKGTLQATSHTSHMNANNNNALFLDKSKIGKLIETVCKCSDEYDDGVHLQVVKVLLTAITSTYCEIHDANLLHSTTACFHIHLMSKTPSIKVAAKAALTQIVSIIHQRMELNDTQAQYEQNRANASSFDSVQKEIGSSDNLPEEHDGDALVVDSLKNKLPLKSPVEDIEQAINTANNELNAPTLATDFASIYHRDAYLMFRALCKLSMRGFADESQAYNDNIVLQNKVLSLELIQHLLRNCGNAFKSGEKFIYAIRTFLCVSLLNNCTSHMAQVTGLSLQIFILLMQNFKEHLKSEVEVFVSTIFLRILESENSTYDHKVRVLEVFHTICRDPTTQIELFINYDCDIDAINLFTRVVSAFAKITKNPWSGGNNNRMSVDFMANASKRFQSEDLQMRSMGLEGLILVLKSLVIASGVGASGNVSLPVSPSLSSGNNVGDEVEEKKEHDFSHNSGSTEAETKGSSSIPINDSNQRPSPASFSPRHYLEQLSSTVDASNTNMVEVFDKKLKVQEEVDNGIIKFNLSPMKGIKYLVSLGHLRIDAKEVAQFLHEHVEKLDKTMVGDLLGREKDYENGFCYKILHEYVQSMDFSTMTFDMAMRYFLSGFRLPGEAQKIDRIMEKFAERYYIQHKEEFASADMAFILAFSTIMLQTNLHNPAIRDDKRMTKEQFIRQNKGISSDGELSEELLSNIYDRIAAQPISITQDGSRKGKKDDQTNNSFIVFQSLVDRKKKDAFTNERKEMLKAGEAMIKQNKKRASVFLKNTSLKDEILAYIKAMFEIVWPPSLAVLSQILETFDETTLIKQCLQGFQLSILLACRLEVSVARNTFVNSLAKFTTLDSVREMKMKNLMCTKLLLTTALSEGEYLEESWIQVLQNISHLARLLMFASGVQTDEVFFSDTASVTSEQSSRPQLFSNRKSSNARNIDNSRSSNISTQSSIISDPFTKLFLGLSRAETTRLVEEANSELLCKDIDSTLIDKIFSSSTNLSGGSILHFVRCLCEVSLAEISSSMNALRGRDSVSSETSAPRVFSLQKLVEVADLNMNLRSRMEWSKIWSLLTNHFSVIGTNDNQALAMFAIDSLKQLSIKFLQKDELSNFNFQRIFLKPFEKIMAKSKSMETKDLIVRCLYIMIKTCANNIHSGWKSIFNVFNVAANQDNFDIAKLAFDIVEQLVNEQFGLLVNDFVDVMNCLVTFAASRHTNLSLRSLSYLTHCADRLAQGDIPLSVADETSSTGLPVHVSNDSMVKGDAVHNQYREINGDDSVFRLWWPLLLGLSTRVGDARMQVRLKALDSLQHILRQHGSLFSQQAWSVIFKGVLFPMMDSAKTDSTSLPRSVWPSDPPTSSFDKHSWIGSLSMSVLNACVDLYLQFRGENRTNRLLNDLLCMLSDCMLQGSESLARIAAQVLLRLVIISSSSEEGIAETLNKEDTFQVEQVQESAIRILLDCLIADFHSAGSLSLQDGSSCPTHIRSLLLQCPLRKRLKRLMHAEESQCLVSKVVQTEYGRGVIKGAVIDSGLAEERWCIELSWGGQLFTSRDYKDSLQEVVGSSQNYNIKTKETVENAEPMSSKQPWSDFSESVMTCLIMNLELIKVNHVIFRKYGKFLALPTLEKTIGAIETTYWHAVAFNQSLAMRLRLQTLGFMNRNAANPRATKTLPNLLEQEVLALRCLLDIVFTFYEHSLSTFQGDALCLIRPFVERYSVMALSRYLSFEGMEGVEWSSEGEQSEEEEEANNTNHSSNSSGVLRDQEFRKAQRKAYLPSIQLALERVMNFTDEAFEENSHWLVPMLTKIIVCSNHSLRTLMSSIFHRFVDPKFTK